MGIEVSAPAGPGTFKISKYRTRIQVMEYCSAFIIFMGRGVDKMRMPCNTCLADAMVRRYAILTRVETCRAVFLGSCLV